METIFGIRRCVRGLTPRCVWPSRNLSIADSKDGSVREYKHGGRETEMRGWCVLPVRAVKARCGLQRKPSLLLVCSSWLFHYVFLVAIRSRWKPVPGTIVSSAELRHCSGIGR
jgi:hypothetical protein